MRALNIPPDLHSPTGATAVHLMSAATRAEVLVFRGRDLGVRGREFDGLVGKSDLIHWHLNLAHFPAALSQARGMTGRIAQLATVHHLEDHEEMKVSLLEGTVDAIQAPATDVAEKIRGVCPTVPVVVVPYLVHGWDHIRVREPEGRAVVGWCGQSATLDGRKDLRSLVVALGMLNRSGMRVDLAVQGRQSSALNELAGECGVSIRQMPWMPWAKREAFFDQIDIYVSPSLLEGGPLPVMEAVSHGCPAAFTRTGVGGDLLSAGAGVEIPMKDPRGQADVIGQLLSMRRLELDRVASEARITAESIIGPQVVLKAYKAAWAQALFIGGGSSLRTKAGPLTSRAVNHLNATEMRLDHLDQARWFARSGLPKESMRLLAKAHPWSLPWGPLRRALPDLVRGIMQ